MQLNASQLLKAQQSQSRATHYARLEQAQTAEDAQSVLAGTNLGWDANSGRRRVGLPGGRVILARDITSGAIAIGASVQATISKGSLEAYCDAMPS